MLAIFMFTVYEEHSFQSYFLKRSELKFQEREIPYLPSNTQNWVVFACSLSWHFLDGILFD